MEPSASNGGSHCLQYAQRGTLRHHPSLFGSVRGHSCVGRQRQDRLRVCDSAEERPEPLPILDRGCFRRRLHGRAPQDPMRPLLGHRWRVRRDLASLGERLVPQQSPGELRVSGAPEARQRAPEEGPDSPHVVRRPAVADALILHSRGPADAPGLAGHGGHDVPSVRGLLQRHGARRGGRVLPEPQEEEGGAALGAVQEALGGEDLHGRGGEVRGPELRRAPRGALRPVPGLRLALPGRRPRRRDRLRGHDGRGPLRCGGPAAARLHPAAARRLRPRAAAAPGGPLRALRLRRGVRCSPGGACQRAACRGAAGPAALRRGPALAVRLGPRVRCGPGQPGAHRRGLPEHLRHQRSARRALGRRAVHPRCSCAQRVAALGASPASQAGAANAPACR
mmetsp:Transcript_993/g.3086  ORF Transcript_993/g.3086 Transcript_993/m.3086 type:complete len:394 (-) Transcript_993:30-1211(-)